MERDGALANFGTPGRRQITVHQEYYDQSRPIEALAFVLDSGASQKHPIQSSFISFLTNLLHAQVHYISFQYGSGVKPTSC